MSALLPLQNHAPVPETGRQYQVMLLSASAGIMDGDRQEFDLNIREGASVEFISQSYEKSTR